MVGKEVGVMLITQIMEKDVDNCYETLCNDDQLKEIDDKFYSLLSQEQSGRQY